MNRTKLHPVVDVAIVGGGFTGAAVAHRLAQLIPQASIVIFEPRESLGRGLAYDDPDPSHRINVPASRMSLIPENEGHFARWVEARDAIRDDPEADVGLDQVYPRRTVFGHYVSEQIAPLVASGRIRHVREGVSWIGRQSGAWRITTDSGSSFVAGVTVLATTHPRPEPPVQLVPFASHKRVVADPLDIEALRRIPRNARVLIVGTGLTMADVVASLDRAGHEGQITAISRRGLRSRGHPAASQDAYGAFGPQSGRTPSKLLRRIRQVVRAAAGEGISWHAVLDAVRRDGPVLWGGFSIGERRRIVRHLRVFWDVHRFRIAPQVESVLERRISDGKLDIVAGSLRSAEAAPDGLRIEVVRRRSHQAEQFLADYVVICTGPAHGGIMTSLPYLGALARDGLIASDQLRLGIACDLESRALDSAGTPVPTLFIAGPLARGTFGELMGVPEVAAHAVRVAESVAQVLAEAEIDQRASRA